MIARVIIATACLAVPLSALAAQPDLQPGNWEYTNVTRFEGMPMPDQMHSHTECLTQEDIDRGAALFTETEGCEVTSMDMRSEGVTYSMVCTQEGMTMNMDGDLRFMGDRANGTVEARMQGPTGPMRMHIKLEGRRIGDC
jgi:hypothetical protein